MVGELLFDLMKEEAQKVFPDSYKTFLRGFYFLWVPTLNILFILSLRLINDREAAKDGLQGYWLTLFHRPTSADKAPTSRCEGDGTKSSLELLAVAGLDTLHRVPE